MKYPLLLGVLIAGIIIGLFFCKDPNASLQYGDTGLPKNCRAIIHENIVGYNSGEFPASHALESINRNCGKYGYSW